MLLLLWKYKGLLCRALGCLRSMVDRDWLPLWARVCVSPEWSRVTPSYYGSLAEDYPDTSKRARTHTHTRVLQWNSLLVNKGNSLENTTFFLIASNTSLQETVGLPWIVGLKKRKCVIVFELDWRNVTKCCEEPWQRWDPALKPCQPLPVPLSSSNALIQRAFSHANLLSEEGDP